MKGLKEAIEIMENLSKKLREKDYLLLAWDIKREKKTMKFCITIYTGEGN